MGYELLELGINKLGYGNMRLPFVNGEIDYDTIFKMVDAFIASGGSYFDTAFAYLHSEEVLRKALVERYPRDKYFITTKAALFSVKTPEELQEQIGISLERLGLDYVDNYFLHALSGPLIEKADRLGAWDYLKSLKEKGLTKHIGFSFHGTPEELEMLLDNHPEVELVQLQVNYLDWDDPKVQSRRLVEIANAHKVPFSVMEPNKGGWLASEVSENGKYLKGLHPDVSNASLAFRYVLELEGLFVCLSGMGNMDELEDNIKTFANYTPLTDEERTHIAKAVDIIHSYPNIPCTGCSYCTPNCPKKIQIPHFMDLYNKYLKYKNLDTIRHLHFMHTSKGKPGPAACVKCGVCASHCPQHLDIPDVMAEFTKILEQE